ncbi:MAG: hypothetical protein HYZ53_08445 [Planctomycetes bacterium]|nr:hypothetical protein [Planctomycetota bacterium]
MAANFDCVIADHPSFSETPREPALWKETHGWNQSIILWLVSPDRSQRVPIEYLDAKTSKPLSADELLARIGDVVAKNLRKGS